MIRHGKWKVYSSPTIPVESRRIVGLVETSDGSIWIGFSRGNILRLEYSNARWLSYPHLYHSGTDKFGRECFIDSSRRVVIQTKGSQYMASYGPEDGLIDHLNRLHVTTDGSLWAVGSHEGIAATARMSDSTWVLDKHPDFAQSTGSAIGSSAPTRGTMYGL